MKYISLTIALFSLVPFAVASPLVESEMLVKRSKAVAVKANGLGAVECVPCPGPECSSPGATTTTLADGESVSVQCWAKGDDDMIYEADTEAMNTSVGNEGYWARIDKGCYVSGARLNRGWRKKTPRCA